MMAKACGFTGHDVMFSSNVTPANEYAYAKDMGVIINFDDITHLKYFEENTKLENEIIEQLNKVKYE